MEAVVVLTQHSSRPVQTKYGDRVVHTFTDSAGQEYDTFKQPVADAAYRLLNQHARVVFDLNGDYAHKLTAVEAASAGGAPAAPVSAPSAGAPAPSTGAPATITPSSTTPAGQVADKDTRIMRQNALANALKTVELGLIQLDPNRKQGGQVLELADAYIQYYVYGHNSSASAAAQTAAAADPPPAPVTSEPAPLGASAAVHPDDDIPF